MIYRPAEEILPIVDEHGNIIGNAPRSYCHGGSKVLHPVVHLHIIDSGRNGLLLQKRAMKKRIQPGKWDTSVGGHVSYGETVEDALKREAMEEASLYEFHPTLITRYIFESDVEREFINCFGCVAHSGYRPEVEEGEADSVRFWTWNEIDSNIGKSIFTPNFESEYTAIVKLLRSL